MLSYPDVNHFLYGITILTIDEFIASVANDTEPSADFSPELTAIWHTKAENWEQAHNIAQDIHTEMGSWIHALLHLIEGDIGNSAYWFNRAGRTARKPSEIDSEWEAIATELLSAG